ncbi:glycosyltransferase [Streptomyces ureilyticus]|uniref:Glycosyltransferase family 4 protein n=1 Tax=Streptomyces ureilyticus TaxID=1775131 RepID=A0ABX0E331_9ACTN|nr:glycosyltransferase [Streptomyces ureilyticus]NGO48108.1 glycosyltransferase family 4 protein [Streptomyces ureilyticus]
MVSRSAGSLRGATRRGTSPRILHITQPVDGGVANVVTELVRAQRAAGSDVTVACPDSGLAQTLRELGADVRRWPATRAPGWSLPGEVRRLARVIDEVRPEVLHAHSAKAGLAARLAVRGRIPTVFQPHAWSFEAVGGLTAAAALAWERWAARWAARVVCVSEAERARGVRAGVRAHWQVIPNGVDPRRFHPAADNAVQADPAVQAASTPLTTLDPSAPLVVCVGRLCRQKGQDVLLQAWPSVLRQVPAARLALVGDGPDEEQLREHAPEGVLFAGAVADAVPWYQTADLVVLPSRWEGMALAPLEAMACGRPVVVTDVAGARESLPPGHRAHCLVPPGRPGPLADALARALLDPLLREALGHQGRRHVLTAHDVRHSAEAVAALYRELLDAGRTVTQEHIECRESNPS